MSKKKKLIIVLAVIVVLAVAGLGIWYFLKGSKTVTGDTQNAVFVDSVANITGLGSGNGQTGRFSGVVEPQETWKIEVSQDKKVEEVFVEVGQEVKKGDKLFTYNTQEMQDSLNQAELDLESKQNDIDTTNEQIAELEAEKKKASQEEQLSYTTQIQTAQNTVKRSEYEKKAKAVEIENLKKQIANADVLCELDGVVKSINKDGTEMSATGEAEPFMTVLATGDYRVKGKVNEQNMSQIIEGQPVIVRSRVDLDKTWKGTLSAVDTDKAESSNNGMMYGGNSNAETTSSNYPFYVVLESKDGLMLGQHVYIEMDNGQDEKKEGLWLDSFYIVMEDEKPDTAYVWASNDKEKLEKRKLKLGEFDEELQQYQILEGLTQEDYIAFPDDTFGEGDPTTKNIDQGSMDGMDGMNGAGGMEDGSMDNEGMDGSMDNMVPGSGPSAVPDMGGVSEDMDISDEEDMGVVESEINNSAAAPQDIGVIGGGSAPASAIEN